MTTLAEANQFYRYTAHVEIRRHIISHATFNNFCVTFHGFVRKLGEAADDPYWQPLLRYLSRYRFVQSATPVPFDNSTAFSPAKVNDFEAQLSLGRTLYPTFAPPAVGLLEKHVSIAEQPRNPLLDAIKEHQTDESAIVVKDRGLVGPTQEAILTTLTCHARVLVPAQLSQHECFEHLIVLGPARWFPDCIFTAPRAPRIDIMLYAWIRDTWKPTPLFISSAPQTAQEPAFPVSHGLPTTIDAESALPAISWSAIVQDARQTAEHDHNEREALLFLLEGGGAVFLENEEQASVGIIDLTDNVKPVKRARTNELAPGMVVLLRTRGGGDYIVPIADRILGPQAAIARAKQRQWKQLLRDSVLNEGATVSVEKLRMYGSRIANETNLKNWMSDRNIKTAGFEDFNAIMTLIGKAAHAQTYWDTMGMIDQAHRKAGFHIRRLLIRQILAADLTQLQDHGTLKFTIQNEDGGSITAFRIEQVAPGAYQIPHTRLGHIIPT